MIMSLKREVNIGSSERAAGRCAMNRLQKEAL
jgi:hypothetical protein